jgi:hypothetical protein
MNHLKAVITPKAERTEYSYLSTGELSEIKDVYCGRRTGEHELIG